MILKGYEDLRVAKTISGIKTAFEELILEKDYGKITVKELCDRARINKKTFYRYYDDLDALLAEMQLELSSDYIKRIEKYNLPEDLDKVNREFFVYSSEQGPAYEKITCGETYRFVRENMISRVNDAGWSKSEKYRNLTDYEKVFLMNFINTAVLTAYRQWVEEGKRMPLEEVVTLTNSIVLGGVKEFFDEHD